MTEIPDNIVSFMVWVYRNTSYIQEGLVQHKGELYRTNTKHCIVGEIGALNDLWLIYVKETIG